MDDHGTTHWSEGLAPVIFAINTRTTATTKKTPFQLVFGQDPRADSHYWRAVHDASLTGLVEIDDLLIDTIQKPSQSPANEPKRSVSFVVSVESTKKPRRRSLCKILPMMSVLIFMICI